MKIEQNTKEEDKKKKEKKQVLIEDGTMAAFGFKNPAEIVIDRD